MMDIPPANLPSPPTPQVNQIRDGIVLLKGLMNNQVAIPAGKSLLVELIDHVPLPATLLQQLSQLAKPTAPLPSWQPLLANAPLELLELKLQSGQKIFAATLRTWFEATLAQLPAKMLLEVKASRDGQLIIQPQPNNNSAASTPLPELWRKSLPMAQSPKLLMQLMAPLVKPLASLTPNANHPLQPVQQFMQRQTQAVNSLLNLVQTPSSPEQKQHTGQAVVQLMANSGVFFESKLRALLSKPAGEHLDRIAEISNQDFKAQILKSIFAINQHTPESTSDEEEWPEHLWRLFLGNPQEAPKSTAKSGNWLLLETLLPSLQKTLAGIQLQQTHSLAEHDKNPGALRFELPIPSADGWINLFAHLTPVLNSAIDEGESSAQQARATANTWRLLLEFNLPQNGLLAVQFLWQPGLLRGQVWANQPKLKKQLKEQLRQLQKSLLEGGINAEQLHITDEPIQRPPLPIHQPLVDIQT